MEVLNQYVVTHKKINIKYNQKKLLLVGASNKEKADFKGYLFDDMIEDNISSKNKNYCELTGLYYIWKSGDYEFAGLEHYRRFFAHPIKTLFFGSKLYTTKEYLKMLKKYDVLIPKKVYMHKSIYSQYSKEHNSYDLDSLRDVIMRMYPDYLEAFDQAMRLDYLYPFNMFVMRKELLNLYCSFLFSVLFGLEHIIDISNYDDYQQRVFGFLSERLMNVFLIKNRNLKVKELFVFNSEKSRIKECLKYFLRKK